MRSLLPVALCAATALATAGFEGRRYDYETPSTPASTFTANYTTTADALDALSSALSPNASMAAPLTVQYGSTIGRVWPKQLETWPEAIVYPNTPGDVSIIMQFYSIYHALWEDGFAIMCGGHFSSGGAQSNSLIIDLQNLNNVIVNDPVDEQEPAILKIGGGTKSGHVYDVLDGTGWAFLGARSTTIGKKNLPALSNLLSLLHFLISTLDINETKALGRNFIRICAPVVYCLRYPT